MINTFQICHIGKNTFLISTVKKCCTATVIIRKCEIERRL